MSSQKDKEYHKLRNPEKYSGLKSSDIYGYLTKEGAEAHVKFRLLWGKYGFRSMVGDKRRRNKTRKSNQRDKQVLHQIERAQFKSNLRAHLINQDSPIETIARNGNIVH